MINVIEAIQNASAYILKMTLKQSFLKMSIHDGNNSTNNKTSSMCLKEQQFKECKERKKLSNQLRKCISLIVIFM